MPAFTLVRPSAPGFQIGLICGVSAPNASPICGGTLAPPPPITLLASSRSAQALWNDILVKSSAVSAMESHACEKYRGVGVRRATKNSVSAFHRGAGVARVVRCSIAETRGFSPARRLALFVEAPGHALEPARALLQHPLHDAAVVVAVSQIVIQRRKAVCLAILFHLVQLRHLELVLFNRAPVIRRRIHREARRKRAIHANDDRVLAGAAVPRFPFSAQKVPHIVQALHRI